jgi:hypothetical protein
VFQGLWGIQVPVRHPLSPTIFSLTRNVSLLQELTASRYTTSLPNGIFGNILNGKTTWTNEGLIQSG